MQFYKKNATRRQQYIKSDSSLACKIRKRKKKDALKKDIFNCERRQSESNRCIVVLQTSPLPLGYDAITWKYYSKKKDSCLVEFTIFQNVLLKQDKNQKFRTGTQLQSRKFLAESKSEEPQQERKEANCLQTMRWLFEFSCLLFSWHFFLLKFSCSKKTKRKDKLQFLQYK